MSSMKAMFEKVQMASDDSKEFCDKQKLVAEKEGIYTFISIDLVNSTIFKTRYIKYWPFVIRSFYDIVTNALGAEDSYRGTDAISYIGEKSIFDTEKMKTDGFRVWKLVGDEVLLYHKIVSVSELLNTIRIMDYVTRNIGQLFIAKSVEHYDVGTKEREEFDKIAKRHLAAKTTMWVAECGREITLDCPNMFYDSSVYMDSVGTCLDFLGPDIDAGFRLCGYAEKNKIILSPNLIVLLSVHMNENEKIELKSEIEAGFRIVTYVKLEDIWERRLYPVFMYCPSGNNNRRDWEALFEYDEQKTSKLTEFVYGQENYCDNDIFSYKQLTRIYKDLGRYEEIETLKEHFRSQIAELKRTRKIIITQKHNFEFHISCACYDPKTKKVWIQKHKNHGLSFGCIRITMNRGYQEFVKVAYKERYEIEIEFGEELDCLSFYSVNRPENKEEILGVILFVTGKPSNSVSSTQKYGWYTIPAIARISKKQKRINEFDYVISKITKRVGLNDE